MAKIIQVTNYPILSINSISFVKEIVKDNSGHWKLIVVSDPMEATRYGDEAILIVEGLRQGGAYTDGTEQDHEWGTSRVQPSLSIIEHV